MFAGHDSIPISDFTMGFCINFTMFSVNMVKLMQKSMKVGKETTAFEKEHFWERENELQSIFISV